jgi:hypothetical protein
MCTRDEKTRNGRRGPMTNIGLSIIGRIGHGGRGATANAGRRLREPRIGVNRPGRPWSGSALRTCANSDNLRAAGRIVRTVPSPSPCRGWGIRAYPPRRCPATLRNSSPATRTFASKTRDSGVPLPGAPSSPTT